MELSRSAPVSAPAFSREARQQLWTLTDRPGLVVVHGHPDSSRLAHYFLAAPLLRGEAILFLDAANCFNPYRLVSFARQCRRSPEEFLQQVRISRAFTCFQLAELVERTPAAARRYGAQHVVLTGLPDIFDDEELSPAEVREVFTRSLAQLRRWPQLSLTALVFSDAGSRPKPIRANVSQASPLGAWLHQQLARQATAVYRLEESLAGLRLHKEKRTALVGQTFLSARNPSRAQTGMSAPPTQGLVRVWR